MLNIYISDLPKSNPCLESYDFASVNEVNPLQGNLGAVAAFGIAAIAVYHRQ